MSRMQSSGVRRKDSAHTPADVLPLFVCPGAKEVAIQHAVFPYGSGFSEMVKCPLRDGCAWYALHDLGGDFAFNEQPQERLLSGAFEDAPAHCAQFRLIEVGVASQGRCDSGPQRARTSAAGADIGLRERAKRGPR